VSVPSLHLSANSSMRRCVSRSARNPRIYFVAQAELHQILHASCCRTRVD
jgi:hypothetical protein